MAISCTHEHTTSSSDTDHRGREGLLVKKGVSVRRGGRAEAIENIRVLFRHVVSIDRRGTTASMFHK